MAKVDMRVMPGKLRGIVRAYPSKSSLHRALICQALSGGKLSVPDEMDAAEDVLAMARCMEALCRDSAAPVLDCGESAATLRFLLPVAAAMGRGASFTGGRRLAERPLLPLLALLRRNGCHVDSDTLPLSISGVLTPGEFTLSGDVTSQYVSGLLLALPLLGGDSRIRLLTPLVSAGYVQMTIAAMAAHGVGVREMPDGYLVPGGQVYKCAKRQCVEGDWSCAAFFFVANCIGSAVDVQGLADASQQPDRMVVAVLNRMRQGGARIDVSQCPDLFPALAVAACHMPGGALLTNAARLRHKESDRIRAVAKMITALGGQAHEQPDGLAIGECALCGGVVDSMGDHRIAMAAAIAATTCSAPVVVRGAEAVGKSYPIFWQDFCGLGGVAHVV